MWKVPTNGQIHMSTMWKGKDEIVVGRDNERAWRVNIVILGNK